MAQIIPCFENIIGLRNSCNSNESSSGLYINDLGISLNELNSFVTEDYESGEHFFESQKNLAINVVTQQIHTFFQERYKAFSVLSNKRIGYYADSFNFIPVVSGNNGLLFELENDESYLDVHISEISIATDYDGDINITVHELISGELLDTFTVNQNGNNITTIYPKKVYSSNRKKMSLFFSWNGSGINIRPANLNNTASCSTCSGSTKYNNEFIYSSGGIIQPMAGFHRQNFQSKNNTGGLSIVYSLNCNHQSWLCSISNLIAMPILYKTASFITEFGMLISPNEMMNSRITMNRELLEKRQSMYEAKYTESMNNILNNIELPSDERCFVCRQRSRTTVMLP